LTSLLLLLYSDPPPDIPWRDILVSNKNVFTQILILPSVRLWHQTTAAVHRADSCLTSGVVSCCKQDAKVGICCSQLYNHGPLCWWHRGQTGGGPASFWEILVYFQVFWAVSSNVICRVTTSLKNLEKSVK